MGPYEVGALRLEEAIMLKLIALLGAMAALTACSDERRFFPRQDFCCEGRRFFPRREFEESRDFCCEERRPFPRREFEESWF